jgi:hypothetical protein
MEMYQAVPRRAPPDPRTLPGDPAGFVFGVQLLIGPADGPGEESFELTVCSPEWLAERCKSGEPVNGLHHVIAGLDTYDERVPQDWLEARVLAVEAATWAGIASQLRFPGGWDVLRRSERCQIEQVPRHDRRVRVIVPPAHPFDLK